MGRLEKMISEIRRQILPYRHDQDVAKGFERWDVDEEECLSAWLQDQISACRTKNGCEKRGACAYYSYSDIAKRNYDVCYEMHLLLESGELRLTRKSEPTPEI